MPKEPKQSGRYLWTGAMSIDMDTPGEIAGLVAAVSPLSRPGRVQISLHRRTCPPEEHEQHINFFISEGTARRLIEQLTRVVHRAESLRALHRLGRLRDEELWDNEDLPWQFVDDSEGGEKEED